MARARSIKPGFFQNEILAELSPHARLLFIGLWMVADCDGRLEDRPKRISAAVFPYEDVDVPSFLDDLARCGFIERYTVLGSDYISIIKWSKHQNPHKQERESTIPPPEKADVCPVISGATPEKADARRASSLTPSSLTPESLFTETPFPEKPVSETKSLEMETKTEPTDADLRRSGELLEEFLGMFLAAGVPMNIRDRMRCEQMWCMYEPESHLDIVADVRQKIRDGTWPDERRTKRPWNYLQGQEWTRKAMPRVLPIVRKSVGDSSMEMAARRFLEDK